MKNYFYQLAVDRVNGPVAAILKFVLLMLSFVYQAGVIVTARLYRWGIFKSFDLQRPVVSVGNITWGGVGKTPMVELIAGFCKEKKSKPVILTRGYAPSKDVSADEPALLRRALKDVPVWEGRDRVLNAQYALAQSYPGVFILDDGFQHWRVKRNLDVVLIDAVNPFGNGRLIPRGSLREPLSALRRADIFVLTKVDRGHAQVKNLVGRLAKINPRALVVESIHQPVVFLDLKATGEKPLSECAGQKVVAFCSIGDPAAFRDSLHSLGSQIQKFFEFPDHYAFSQQDIRVIVESCRKYGASAVLTTEKDAVKLEPYKAMFKDIPLFSLKIKMRITKGNDEFLARISRVLER